MSITDHDRGAGAVHGIWEGSRGALMSYSYLGCSSELRDRYHAEGHMRLRRDMRTGAGLLSAPVAIAMLDTAGINIDRYYHAACTGIDVHLLDTAADVDELRTIGSVVREARTQVFTEARFEDAENTRRLLGFGTVSWAIIGPTPEGFDYTDPGPGVADSPSLPPLSRAYHAQAQAGGSFVIEGLSSDIGTDSMHHGPILVTLEAAALEAASKHLGTDMLSVDTASSRLVRAARRGPFVTTSEVMGVIGDKVACRAEMRDEGADNCVVAVAFLCLRKVV